MGVPKRPRTAVGGQRHPVGAAGRNPAANPIVQPPKIVPPLSGNIDIIDSNAIRDTSLDSLTPQQKVAIRLLARGRPKLEIANKAGCTTAAIYKWEKQFPFAVEQAIMEVVDPGMIFQPMVPSAASAYYALLSQTTDLAQLRATAQDVFDRQFGKPVQRAQIESHQTISITFQDATEAEEQEMIDAQYRKVDQGRDLQGVQADDEDDTLPIVPL